MADYYPLVARAVAALSPNTAEARQNIYERARAALTRQLASLDPPPAGEVIDREINALEDVIRRIEAEHAGPAQATPDAPRPAPPPPRRPPAPRREQGGAKRSPIYAAAAALGLVVVAAVATLAYLRRGEPPAVVAARNPPVAQAPVPAPAPPKADERVTPAGGTPASGPPPPPPLSTQPPPPARPAIAVANRALMAMEGVDRPENIVIRQGAVVWRTESAPGAPGQPPQTSIKAIVDVPEARMRVEVTIQRNLDPALPASHTIQIQFAPGPDSEFGSVRNLSQMEFRQTENQPGFALVGQGIAVVENLFLLALANVEPALSRNVEMMRTRPVIYIEFQNAANRKAALLIEKGVSGAQVFEEAFRAWR